MGKSVLNDLLRDNNFRYFSAFFKRLKTVRFKNLLIECRAYYRKFSVFPKQISNQKSDLKYKLFVFYNYFKIIYVHPQISLENLLDYFPTRLQRYFLYELDPKDKRIITFDKVLFYQELIKAELPFPKSYFYKEDNNYYSLNGMPVHLDLETLPQMLFTKPIRDNGGVNARIIGREEIYAISNGFIVQELVQNHKEIVCLSGSHAFNTVRIISYIDNRDEIHILSAIIRLSKGEQVDNWGKGSINVEVDIESGKLGDVGITKRSERFTQHPSGNIPFKDFQIPFWSDLVRVVEKGSKHFPYLRLIAWDIGISSNGPIIVEANAGCDFFHAQLFKPYGKTVLISDLLENKGR